MKRFLIFFAFIGLFSQQALAGSAVSCHDCAPSSPNFLTAGNNGARNAKMPVNVKNAAYFNTKDAVVRTFPKALQVRSSAISLTETDFLALIQPNMRQEYRTAPAATTVSMNIGIDDRTNPQTWTLPTNILSNFTLTRYLDFIGTADVPAAAQVAGATHVNKRTYLDADDGHTLVEYSHYQFNTGQQIQELGTTMIDKSDGDAVANHGEAAQLYADSPLDLNDVFTSHVTDYADDSDLPKRVITNAVTVDGFGTINNPFGAGTLNCLRTSIVETTKEYTTNAVTPSSTITRYLVGWVTKEGFRFYAKKTAANPMPDGNGEVSLSSLEISRFMPMPVLAVELIDFQGVATKDGVDLTWATASEKDNDFYDIERSADGKTFEKIGQVKGNGTTNVKHAYNFTDNTPLSITTYFRLKQTDFDGTSTTSNIIAISPKAEGKGIRIYPNPSNAGSVSIELCGDGNGRDKACLVSTGEVVVVNSIGQTVFQQKTNGETTLRVDVSTWAKGVYVVKMNGNTEGVKFVKN
jgi:hypothetical protein